MDIDDEPLTSASDYMCSDVVTSIDDPSSDDITQHPKTQSE